MKHMNNTLSELETGCTRCRAGAGVRESCCALQQALWVSEVRGAGIRGALHACCEPATG